MVGFKRTGHAARLARAARFKARQTGKPGPILMRRDMVMFLPAVALAALWFGPEAMMLLGTTAILVGWMTRPMPVPADGDAPGHDKVTGIPMREEGETIMDQLIADANAGGRGTACLVVGLDHPEDLARQLHHHEFEEILRRCSERLRGALRDTDRLARLDGARFAVMLRPTLRPDLESMIQLSGRLQDALEAPFSVAQRSVSAYAHVGFCHLARCPDCTGKQLVAAAEAAADEAARNGPGAIRAYSREVRESTMARNALSSEVGEALESGRITAFFQPQISTDTGEISGLQAVPRWLHRKRGLLSEAELLPAIDNNDLYQRLAEVMLYQTFNALRELDRRGDTIWPVSLPLGPHLLLNPKLAERLKWEFDRFEMRPERVRLVISQKAAARLDQDIVVHNLRSCATMGCPIEMAGFGNGPVSVASIRETGADRLRIHRSLVEKVDKDPEQQRFVAAIITMADGLGLQTIAEGVSAISEHAMLSQLGCRHVQGRAIAAPMPLEELHDWTGRHLAKLATTPKIGGHGKG